jgi:hypothetical protein
VSDIFKGLTGGGWAGLTAWILPSGLALGLFWVFVYPHMRAHYPPFDVLDATQKTFVWLAAAVTIGLFFNALSTPMYRVLEGYLLWPRRCQDRGKDKQRAIKAKLLEALGGAGWARGLQDERLARFPQIDEETAPTRLGNAMRAFETYGATRFGLDSQVMWSELSSLVPKSLQTELDRSRASVDFFVALIYLSMAFGIVTIAFAFDGRIKPILILIGLLALLSIFIWYEMAVISTSYWSTTVQALVNLGRVKLANEMGLEIPKTIEEEREMWWALTSFVYDNTPEAMEKLNKYRKYRAASPNAPNETTTKTVQAPDTETASEQEEDEEPAC